jgi:glutamate-1-semialdehyde 2,1-aminomutase
VVVRIQGHFHGWHDYAMIDWLPPYEVHASAGVPDALEATMRAVPRDDLGALDAALAPGDVAAVIAEPDGPVVGTVPVDPAWVRGLRDVTDRHGVLLIFDEVVTGFRLAPGGAQEYFGVKPDLATFAKAIAGGLPGAAVAGRADVMSQIAYTGDPTRDRRERVVHMGTYSAHPTAAVAGIAALSLLADGSVQDRAAGLAERLRAGFNDQLWEHGVAGAAYGLRSGFRVIVGDVDDLPDTGDPAEFIATTDPERLMAGTRGPLKSALHKAFFLEGIDILAGNHGWISGAHTEADVDAAVDGFGRAVGRLADEGLVTTRLSRSVGASAPS